ncbi:MAG: hypothetical protein KAQ92_02165 [Candidatus Aenigmarchaeota archaeon]|nr:hypothetical protein [Candidatus Aenigmarchaeota archaeon]
MERFIIPSIFLGALSGLIFGILLLIPFAAPFIFLFLFILVGIIVIVILKKNSFASFLSPQDGCFIGAVSGFISFIAASIVYLPAAYLIDRFFNVSSNTFSINSSFFTTGYDILAVSMMVFFTGMLSALFNAFSGMITALVFEKSESRYSNFKDHLDIEQDAEMSPDELLLPQREQTDENISSG